MKKTSVPLDLARLGLDCSATIVVVLVRKSLPGITQLCAIRVEASGPTKFLTDQTPWTRGTQISREEKTLFTFLSCISLGHQQQRSLSVSLKAVACRPSWSCLLVPFARKSYGFRVRIVTASWPEQKHFVAGIGITGVARCGWFSTWCRLGGGNSKEEWFSDSWQGESVRSRDHRIVSRV